MVSIKQQIHTYHSLDNWFYSSQGVWVANAFIEILSSFMSELKGEVVLQIGQCGTNPWLTRLDYQHKYIASPYISNQPNHLITSLIRLPLNRSSVDCIFAPLSMEAFKDSNALIDEMDRILAPGGYLVMLGINPFSMWGMASKIGALSGISSKVLHLRSSFSINRACVARGYQQKKLAGFGYIPPVHSKKWIDNFFFMDEIGKMLWPFPAGFYCYIAQKQEAGFILPTRLKKEVVQDNISWNPLAT